MKADELQVRQRHEDVERKCDTTVARAFYSFADFCTFLELLYRIEKLFIVCNSIYSIPKLLCNIPEILYGIEIFFIVLLNYFAVFKMYCKVSENFL